MKIIKCLIGLLICLFSAALVPPSSAAEVPAMLVGRILHIEGDLLRYVPAAKDWVAMTRDTPVGAGDTLFLGNNGMAELIVPTGIWIRIGNRTQIQFIALDADLAETDVVSGMARFYNKDSRAVVKVTSPFGYVLAYPGTVFDFYVGDVSVEVIAIKGTVSFVHSANNAKYDVVTGAPLILADQKSVSSGGGTVDPDWNRWNMVRENFWLAKSEVKGPSVDYLPPGLRYEARTFEENGRWERVPYEGAERWFWRPTTIAVGWSPFTIGRWTDWYGDQCWIPSEPFGYVTHHYGNWVYARSRWYWAPPVVSVRIGLPLLDVGFFWSPGRVAWIHSGIYVGWVPLAPRETYYARRHWGGPHTVVVNSVNISRININVPNHAYVNHAVIVNQNNFYGRNNYRDVRVTNISRTTIINNYRAAPVVNNTVIKNYTTIKQRHNVTNVTVKEKPHNTVINRIQQNETIIRDGRIEKAAVLQERLKRIPEGRINREARIEQPRSTNHIVPANQVNRPKSELNLQQREIKGSGRGTPQVQPGQPIGPEGFRPEKPVQPGQPAVRPERVTPARPERVTPAISAQPERTRPERVAPARPAQQQRPVQPEPPSPRPERVTPAIAAQPERTRPEHSAPERQEQKEKPDQPDRSKPEYETPGKHGFPGKRP
jgi:hypothetical protein